MLKAVERTRPIKEPSKSYTVNSSFFIHISLTAPGVKKDSHKFSLEKNEIFLLTSRFTYPPIKFCMNFSSVSDPKSSLSEIAQ